ncbi:MAG: signal peptidase I [Vicinamibacteria bacterium]|nr:signal peptidase I [Vicinamibacteria bacterium]
MRLRELKNKIWRDWLRPILLVAIVLGSFRSAVADWNDVPTGSMKPTILAGERIFIYRAAYDLRVPFTTWSVWRRGEPERGDIVVLISPHDGKRLVKRVVGLPGDHVALHSNRLVVNGRPVRYETHGTVSGSPDESGGSVFEEKLPGRAHAILLHEAPGPLSSFRPLRVPSGHYFVMGDNRDDSFDSRYWGFVERRQVLGRATYVVLSADPERHYRPRFSRFLKPLI